MVSPATEKLLKMPLSDKRANGTAAFNALTLFPDPPGAWLGLGACEREAYTPSACAAAVGRVAHASRAHMCRAVDECPAVAAPIPSRGGGPVGAVSEPSLAFRAKRALAVPCPWACVLVR